MESSPEGGFNLTRILIRNKWDDNRKPTGETYEFEEVVGYNMKLHNCIKKIIHLNHCDKDEVVTLEEYMKMLKDYYKEIENLIKI
jgi:hypothetical protein